MKGVCRKLSVLLIFALLISISAFGCAKKDDGKTDQNTTQNEPRVKLKMFMSDSNVPYPQGVDQNDNPFINMIKDYANVDLELEVPAYADFTTKLNLMLASANIPDIVHTNNLKPVMDAAESGMFIDLKKYYDSSVNVKKYITPQMMELAKSPSGKYLRIPMAGMPPDVPLGGGIKVNFNYLKKYNNSKYPSTMAEWFDVFKKIKADDPEVQIVSPNKDGMYNGGAFAFNMNGVHYPTDINFYKGGKAMYAFETPEFRVGLQYYKQMYDLGYVDKEFLTRPADSRTALLNKGKIIIGWGATTEIVATNNSYASNAATKDVFQTIAPPIKPEVGNIEYAYAQGQGLIHPQHSLFISQSCKYPDRAFKVIEGLADQKFLDFVAWGTEGQEYNVVNGKKVPVPDKLTDPKRYWSRTLSLVASMQITFQPALAALEQKMAPEDFKAMTDSMNTIDAMAKKHGNAFSDDNLGYVPDATKEKEANDFISETIVKVIIGQQPISWYDTRVAEFKQKYSKLAQDRADYIYKNRAELEKKGFNFWWEK